MLQGRTTTATWDTRGFQARNGREGSDRSPLAVAARAGTSAAVLTAASGIASSLHGGLTQAFALFSVSALLLAAAGVAALFERDRERWMQTDRRSRNLLRHSLGGSARSSAGAGAEEEILDVDAPLARLYWPTDQGPRPEIDEMDLGLDNCALFVPTRSAQSAVRCPPANTRFGRRSIVVSAREQPSSKTPRRACGPTRRGSSLVSPNWKRSATRWYTTCARRCGSSMASGKCSSTSMQTTFPTAGAPISTGCLPPRPG